jgi:hypothetical protein
MSAFTGIQYVRRSGHDAAMAYIEPVSAGTRSTWFKYIIPEWAIPKSIVLSRLLVRAGQDAKEHRGKAANQRITGCYVLRLFSLLYRVRRPRTVDVPKRLISAHTVPNPSELKRYS